MTEESASTFDSLNLPKEKIQCLHLKSRRCRSRGCHYRMCSCYRVLYFFSFSDLPSLFPFLSLLLSLLSLRILPSFGKILECAINLPLTRTSQNTVSHNFIIHQTECRRDMVERDVEYNNTEILPVNME